MTQCIIVSMNEKYAPYFSVLLASVAENASLNEDYEIVVLHDNLSLSCQERLLQAVLEKEVSHSGTESVGVAVQAGRKLREERSLRLKFQNVHSLIEGRQFYVGAGKNRAYLSKETYFRLLVPWLLPEYERALYLDSDVVVRHGWSDIFQTDLEGYLIAGIPDIWGNWECYEAHSYLSAYRREELGLEEPVAYFNAGVTLFNLKLMRETFQEGELIELAMSREWKKHDQDVLNYVCKGKTHFLDYSWNMIECPGKRAWAMVPEQERRRYQECMGRAKIVHYASRKPWVVKGVFFEQEFWASAARSIYFQELFTAFVEEQLSQGECFEAKAYESIKSGKIGVKFIVRCIMAWVKKYHVKSF